MSLLKNAIMRGVLASRPTDNSALTEGRLYVSTDTGAIYRDNGTTWDNVVAGTGGLGTGTYFEEVVTFSGTTATLSHTPVTFVALCEDGKKLRKVGSSPEFSLSTATITLSYTPLSGGKYVASYWY
jgi:hypothetical protein